MMSSSTRSGGSPSTAASPAFAVGRGAHVVTLRRGNCRVRPRSRVGSSSMIRMEAVVMIVHHGAIAENRNDESTEQDRVLHSTPCPLMHSVVNYVLVMEV